MAQERKPKRRQSFLRGALVLTGGMAVVKVMGALFKVPLTYAIGEYGMGLFNVAYHFFAPVFSLATAGFPIAVSRLVSESSSRGRWNDARQVKRVAMPLFLAIGAGGMVLMLLLAPLYCRWVSGAAYALAPMLALAPAVPLACLTSVYRGYYEGLGNMVPTAFSQVLEAAIKLGLGLAAAGAVTTLCQREYASQGTVLGLTPSGEDQALFLSLSMGAAAAVLGVTAGSLVSLAYLALRFRFHGDGTVPRLYRNSPPPRERRETRRRLWAVTLPIALGSLTASAAGLIDATFLQSRLGDVLRNAPQRLLAVYEGQLPEAYRSNPQAIPTYLYGCYTLAVTVYLLVPGITQAFGTSALPNVTAAWARGSRKELRSRMETVVRVTSLFCFPAGVGMAALAQPIAALLYGEGESTPIVARTLVLLGAASLAAAMSGPLSSMLQAVGRADLPVKLLAAAMAMKLGTNWLLCGVPEINVQGAAMGTLLCYLFLAISQLACLRRAAGVSFSTAGIFLRPLACALLCGAAARLLFRGIEPFLPDGRGFLAAVLLACVLFGGAVYFAGMLLLRGIGKRDLLALPNGQKIAKTLEKQGWI